MGTHRVTFPSSCNLWYHFACLSVNVHQKPHINTDTQKQDEMCLHLPSVCVFMSSTRCRGWSRPCLSHRLRMEDYGWPITSLLSLINEDNELPLLPTKPWCSSAGTEQREGCWGLCVKVCVCACRWVYTLLLHYVPCR